MVKDLKTLIFNSVTVSFRLEFLGDLNAVNDIVFKLSNEGFIIDIRSHLNKGNLPLVEPYVEITCTEDVLQKIIVAMVSSETELHIGLDTMRRLPLSENTLERQYFKGEFLN